MPQSVMVHDEDRKLTRNLGGSGSGVTSAVIYFSGEKKGK